MARTVAEINIDLTAAYAARRTAMGMQSRSLDSGQGRLSVTAANLTEINNTILMLEDELAQVQDPGGNIFHVQVDR